MQHPYSPDHTYTTTRYRHLGNVSGRGRRSGAPTRLALGIAAMTLRTTLWAGIAWAGHFVMHPQEGVDHDRHFMQFESAV